MHGHLRHHAWIVLAATAVFFTNLGGPRLWDRDEPRNAGCALEMLQRGDWVVPVFNAELRTHKPVLLYWFMMTAYGVFGVSEFAARFSSALLGVGTVLMTYHIGRRLFGSESGLWAALILSSCLMFGVAARAATPDSVLIFFATLAMLLYVLGTFKPRRETGRGPAAPKLRREGHYFPPSWPVAAVMYGVMGLAVLAKGPVGLVLPVAVIGMFLLLMRLPARPQRAVQGGRRGGWLSRIAGLMRPFAPGHFLRTCWLMRPCTALAAALAVALPWYVLVGLRTDSEWIRGFLLTHNLGRTLNSMEGHGGSVLYYPIALMIGFFPWSVFLTPSLIGLAGRVRRRDPWAVGYLLTACWGGVYIALFSIARTKLPSYITPAYPAFALMTGCFLYHWRRGTALAGEIWTRLGLGTLAAAGVGMLIGLPLAAHRYLPGEEWLGAVGVILLGGAVGCGLLARQGRRAAAAVSLAVTALVFVTALFGFVALRVDRHQRSDVLVDAIAARGPAPQIASFGLLEPSWVFYAGRPIREIPDSLPAEAATFLADNRQAFIITTEERWGKLRPELPGDAVVLASAPYFLKKGNLVVIACGPGANRRGAVLHTAGRSQAGRGPAR